MTYEYFLLVRIYIYTRNPILFLGKLSNYGMTRQYSKIILVTTIFQTKIFINNALPISN